MKSENSYNKKQITKKILSMAHITKLVAYWQDGHDLESDGLAGPVTIASIETALAKQFESTGSTWDYWKGTDFCNFIPKSRRDVYTVFGSPGEGSLSKEWYQKNIVELHKSFNNQLPGIPSKWYVKVHRFVEPYLREALRRAQYAVPEHKIERVGSFNYRHIRHDERRPLSYHSWGIAVDINPHKNFGKTFRKGKAPKPWSRDYMEIWPEGLPKAFVEAFQSCGFTWGCDWDNDGSVTDHTYLDPMHFEWVDRSGKFVAFELDF